MEVIGKGLLPANYLADENRRWFVVSDLVKIAGLSDQLVGINEARVAANTDLLMAQSREVAGLDYFTQMRSLVDADRAGEEAESISLNDALRNRNLNVHRKSEGLWKKHVVWEIHPDKMTAGSADGVDAALGKYNFELSRGNVAGAQAHVARGISRNIGRQSEPVDSLSLKRYKAWIALEGSKTDFGSVADVERWKAGELRLVPLFTRSSFVAMAFDQTAKVTLGAKDGKNLSVPEDIYYRMRSIQDKSQEFSQQTAIHQDVKQLSASQTKMFDVSARQAADLLKRAAKNGGGLGEARLLLYYIDGLLTVLNKNRLIPEAEISAGTALRGLSKVIAERRGML